MPSISHAEALSIINYYGSERKASAALGVSRASLRRLAGTLPTPKTTKAATIANIASGIDKLSKPEKKSLLKWESFFSNASDKMVRKFEKERNPATRKQIKEFAEKLFTQWKKEQRGKIGAKPDSTLQYHIWKAIMRKMYEFKQRELWTV